MLEEIIKYFFSSAVIIAMLIFIGKKYIESYIKGKFNTELEKLKNSLSRKAMAYEFMIKKEFEFYETIHIENSKLLLYASSLNEKKPDTENINTEQII